MFKTITAVFLLLSLASNYVSAQSKEFRKYWKMKMKEIEEMQEQMEKEKENEKFMQHQKTHWGYVDAFFKTRDVIVLRKHPRKDKYYKRTFFADGEKSKKKRITSKEYHAIIKNGVGRNILYINKSKKRIRNIKKAREIIDKKRCKEFLKGK